MFVYLPKDAAGPVPAFVCPNFNGNHAITDDPDVILPTCPLYRGFKPDDPYDGFMMGTVPAAPHDGDCPRSSLREFLAPLGLERSLVVSAAPFRKDSRSGGDGVQVDLMVQTSLSVYFVEIKRQREIGGEVIDEMAELGREML